MAQLADVNVGTGTMQPPAYWSAGLNILFVVDGRVNTSKDPSSFGLGYVLETIRAGGWLLQVNVQVVRRDSGVYVALGQSGAPGDSNYNADGSDPVTNFTFSAGSLAGWDQVWLFGDFPANLSDDHTLAQFFPLNDAELKALAEWMDKGGGVFAAGDHWNLGASMCSRIRACDRCGGGPRSRACRQ